MGNMIFSKRFDNQENIGAEGEKRIFAEHMYKGPLKLGDPTYRGLSKMEEDPLIPQRMRDTARTQLCTPEFNKFRECSKAEVWHELQ